MDLNIRSKTSKGIFLTLVICFAALLFFSGYSSVEAKETVILNSGTYKTCQQICNEELGMQCLSVGTNPDGTDGKWYAPFAWVFCDHNRNGTCGREMKKSLTGKKCQGILTHWTNCRCAEAKKPDFKVIRFAGPSAVAVNETFSYDSTIKNIGEADSPKTVSPRGIIYYADSKEVCGYGLWQSSMRAGGTEDTSCSYFKFSSPGNYKIKVCVDSDNEIDEANENNNCEEKTVKVKAEEIPSDYYFQSPSEDSPTKTDKCYLRHYTSPTSYTDVLQYECGACSYIPSDQCSGDIKGSCTKYANNTKCGDGRWCSEGECMKYRWKVVGTKSSFTIWPWGEKTKCTPEQYGNKRYHGDSGSSWNIERYVKANVPLPFGRVLIYQCDRGKAGEGCTSRAYYDCSDNDVYWFDSCGKVESKKEECGWRGCQDGYCRGTEPNDPISGTISAVPTTVAPLEDITLTIEAQDDQGVAFVAAFYQNKWHIQLCLNETNCTKTWTFKEMFPGKKEYYGFVMSYQPVKGASPTFPISINIPGLPSIPFPTGLNFLSYIPEWKVIGPVEVEVVIEIEPNDPISGTISASPTTVFPLEDITLTIEAQDDQGVVFVAAFYQNKWHAQLCLNKTNCTKSWTFKEIVPGEKEYYGFILGYKIAVGTSSIFPLSINIPGLLPISSPLGLNLLNYITEWKIIGPAEVNVVLEKKENDPVSGIISASETTVGVGEDIALTIKAQDDQGVDEVCLFYYGSWNCQLCAREEKMSCSKTWTFSESAPGKYKYDGYVYGFKPDGTKEGNYTAPKSITIIVEGEGEENDSISGFLSVSEVIVSIGEDITLTIEAQDDQGVSEVYVYYHGSWQGKKCDKKTFCAKTWTFSETSLGDYEYVGYVFGYKSDGSEEGKYTEPYSVTVKVIEEGEEIVDCQESYGPEYWCGNYKEWEIECREKGEAIKLPENTSCKRENETYQYCVTCQEREYESYSPREFIVKFKGNPALKMAIPVMPFVSTKFDTLNNLNEEYRIDDFKELFKAKKALPKTLSNVYKFKTTSGQDLLTIIEEYKKDPNVEYAEPNYLYHTFVTPNDPYYGSQWAHPKINSEQGWDIQMGSSDVVIAVIDTGVDLYHPDLTNNIWDNWDEIEGNGIDDDNNGYIDDIHGWDFVAETIDCDPGDDCSVADNDPSDFDGHGTHVAGIAAAATNNSEGIAGTCWNCKIMPLRVCWKTPQDADCSWDAVAEAIIYAADNDADVINMSFGGEDFSILIEDVLDYASSYGVVLVAAAGNENTDRQTYPAAYNNVIAVAATNRGDELTELSNYGYWVDVAAPGEDIFSTYPSYAYLSLPGTSAAAPFVAGLAGLLLSENPGSNPEDIKQIIKDTADYISSNKYIDGGRINVSSALSFSLPPPPPPTIAEITYPYEDQIIVSKEKISIIGTALGNYYDVKYGQGRNPASWVLIDYENDFSVEDGILASWDISDLANGTYTIKLNVLNDQYGGAEDRVYVTLQTDYFEEGDNSWRVWKDGQDLGLHKDETGLFLKYGAEGELGIFTFETWLYLHQRDLPEINNTRTNGSAIDVYVNGVEVDRRGFNVTSGLNHIKVLFDTGSHGGDRWFDIQISPYGPQQVGDRDPLYKVVDIMNSEEFDLTSGKILTCRETWQSDCKFKWWNNDCLDMCGVDGVVDSCKVCGRFLGIDVGNRVASCRKDYRTQCLVSPTCGNDEFTKEDNCFRLE